MVAQGILEGWVVIEMPMNLSDQRYCEKLIAKYPDKIEIVNVIAAVGELGMLDDRLMDILLREVHKICKQAGRKTPLVIEKVTTKEVHVGPSASLADYYKNGINRNRKGWKPINNGIKGRMLKPGEPMPEGWKSGCLRKPRLLG